MERVDKAIERSLDPNLDAVALKAKIEPPGNTAVVRIGRLPQVRPDCGLALGDVIQNFRAALDHLAWSLVKIGNDPRPANPKRVYFPMAESGKSFRGQINDWLPGVPQDYRAIIRRYQPYRRGDGPKAIRWLRNLSAIDKHRVLIPAVVNQSWINLRVEANWPVARLEYLVRQPRALHVGTPLLRITLASGSGPHCEVKVNGNVTLYPSLGRGLPLVGSLSLIRVTVLEILRTFDELL